MKNIGGCGDKAVWVAYLGRDSHLQGMSNPMVPAILASEQESDNLNVGGQ
jgi:hypothetical protein